MDWRLVPIHSLWPKDTFVKPPAAPIRAPLQLECACATAIPPPSTARDSAASRSICESIDTDRSDTTAHCSDTSTVVPSQSMNAPASAVPTAPHDHHTIPTTAQTMAAPPATCDPRCAPVGFEPSAGSSSSSTSTPASSESCDGSIGPLDRNPSTTRPQSATRLPPPKCPVHGAATRPDAASHHGYELTAPRRGITYAHW